MAEEGESSTSENEVFTLLQPELMTEDQLRSILKDRCVSRNLHNCTKKDLIELFRNVALPLPQREYTGTSWREKRLALKQNPNKNVFRIIAISSKDLCSKAEPQKKVPRLSGDNPEQTRLKPPPDLINYTKKVIKLSVSDCLKKNDDLDKVVIKRRYSATPGNFGPIDESSSNGNEVIPPSKKSILVEFKNDPSSSQDDSPSSLQVEESKSNDTSKKKRQKIVISW